MTSRSTKNLVVVQLICALFFLATAMMNVSAQGQNPTVPKQEVEVLRVNTELVQSPVMVFDKQGHFVDGLQAEQFDLKVDGRPQAISFFDRLTAGTPGEALKFEAARTGRTVAGAAAVPPL